MIVVPVDVKVHLALGHTDMRKGLDGLATLIQEHLKKDPFSGHLFVIRGKNASLLMILFWDGIALCLFTKRIDHGSFSWPRMVEPECFAWRPGFSKAPANIQSWRCRRIPRESRRR
jgi:transposase